MYWSILAGSLADSALVILWYSLFPRAIQIHSCLLSKFHIVGLEFPFLHFRRVSGSLSRNHTPPSRSVGSRSRFRLYQSMYSASFLPLTSLAPKSPTAPCNSKGSFQGIFLFCLRRDVSGGIHNKRKYMRYFIAHPRAAPQEKSLFLRQMRGTQTGNVNKRSAFLAPSILIRRDSTKKTKL